MEVSLKQVSKRFGAQKVLHNAELTLRSGSVSGVTGPNGSGKSTLLQVIAGAIRPDSGSITHTLNGKKIAEDLVFEHVSIAAPFLNLYDDLSLAIALDTHIQFKPLLKGMNMDSFFERIMLTKAREKNIRDLSSGMLQRFKLGLAILCDTPLVLLDEPGSNLDEEGIAWYQRLLAQYRENRTVLICSNREQEELQHCDQLFSVTDL